MAQSTYQLLNLTGNITLTWPSSFSGGPVVLDINDLNPNASGYHIILPDATLVQAGQNFVFNNISGFSVEIVANDESTVLATLTSGEVIQMYLIDVSTSNGTWRVVPFGGGASSITQFTAESTDSSIVITNGTVTPPMGVINFQLPPSLFNLNNVNETSFLVVTNTNPLTFQTDVLVGGTNINIQNSAGITGDPIINLDTTLTGIASAQIGDMTLSGEVITNDVVNGNIQIVTNGTGQVQINGVTIDADGNIAGIGNLVAPKAYCSFTDTLVGMGNIIVVDNSVNVSSVTGNEGTYTVNFIAPMASIEYGVFITLGSTGGSLPFISNGYYIVKQTTSVTIIVTDASGELVLAAPHGVSVMVMSS